MDRLKKPEFAALGLLLGLVAVPVEAGTDSWSVAGQPYGGGVGKVVVNPATPSTLYAVADQEIFESTDSGATWTLILSASSPTLTGDISIDPQHPSTLYAVFGFSGVAPGNITYEQGVGVADPGAIYKTTDGGATWNQIDNGIGLDSTGKIDTPCRVAVDPVYEGVVYAGGCSTGMYKSTDGGADWTSINSGLAPASSAKIQVENLVVDPVTPAVLYVESSYQVVTPQSWSWVTNLYKSADSGATWTILGVTAVGVDADVAIDPSDHTHLLYCGYNQDGAVSTDSGATWNPAGCPAFTSAVEIDPSNPAHVIVGLEASPDLSESVYESTDGGATFTWDSKVPANGVGSFGGIAFDPVTPANIYIGTANWGVIKSTDGGATWNAATQGITGVHAGQMLKGSDGILYMATGNSGIYKSLDQGATWAEVGTGIAGSLPNSVDAVRTFAQDPSTPGTLYDGSFGGLYKSLDAGVTWKTSMTGMPSGVQADSVAIDPEVPATLYAGVEYSSGSNWTASLYKSVNGGATWTSSSSGLSFPGVLAVNAIAVDPRHSAVVFAAPAQAGIYKSIDGATSWTESDMGMGVVDVYAIAIDPTNSDIVYASAFEGFFKSTDAGATWVETDTGITLGSQINGAIQIDPANTSILYVSPKYGFGTTYVSSDAGATWVALTAGLATSSSAQRRTEAVLSAQHMTASAAVEPVTLGAVMIDPSHPTQIYAAGSDGHVYVYDDINPPTVSSSGTGGTPSSGTGNQSTTGSSGGGGGFSWLAGLALLFVARRRSVASLRPTK